MTAEKKSKAETIERIATVQHTLGQYMTPQLIAEKMFEQLNTPISDCNILDPACGDGNLLLAAADLMIKMGLTNISSRLIGIDIDPIMVNKTKKRLSKLLDCSENSLNIFCDDFLKITNEGKLFSSSLKNLRFNVVVSNPPYGNLREYKFFEKTNNIAQEGTELVFLMPLAFLDRVSGVKSIPLNGRPMGVTTGHAIIHHISGKQFVIQKVKGQQTNSSTFKVLSGIKLYAIGSGEPPQTAEILATKPYSSEIQHSGWLPCLRTGDIQPFSASVGRMWVNYGKHLAHPKDIQRFTGAKVFVRRVPIWSNKQLGAVYSEELILCAGDVLVIKQQYDDKQLLKGLCVYLNSPDTAKVILDQRPSLKYRISFPKISAKDINALIENNVPDETSLRKLAAQCKEF